MAQKKTHTTGLRAQPLAFKTMHPRMFEAANDNRAPSRLKLKIFGVTAALVAGATFMSLAG